MGKPAIIWFFEVCKCTYEIPLSFQVEFGIAAVLSSPFQLVLMITTWHLGRLSGSYNGCVRESQEVKDIKVQANSQGAYR